MLNKDEKFTLYIYHRCIPSKINERSFVDFINVLTTLDNCSYSIFNEFENHTERYNFAENLWVNKIDDIKEFFENEYDDYERLYKDCEEIEGDLLSILRIMGIEFASVEERQTQFRRCALAKSWNVVEVLNKIERLLGD